jgi:phosphate starvation-inducible protein PhoH and related proteins
MTAATATAVTLELEPADNERLANLCGQMDEHLQTDRTPPGRRLPRAATFSALRAKPDAVSAARRVVRKLYRQAEREVLTPTLVNLQLQQAGLDEAMPNPTPR